MTRKQQKTVAQLLTQFDPGSEQVLFSGSFIFQQTLQLLRRDKRDKVEMKEENMPPPREGSSRSRTQVNAPVA